MSQLASQQTLQATETPATFGCYNQLASHYLSLYTRNILHILGVHFSIAHLVMQFLKYGLLQHFLAHVGGYCLELTESLMTSFTLTEEKYSDSCSKFTQTVYLFDHWEYCRPIHIPHLQQFQVKLYKLHFLAYLIRRPVY